MLEAGWLALGLDLWWAPLLEQGWAKWILGLARSSGSRVAKGRDAPPRAFIAVGKGGKGFLPDFL